MDASQSEPTRAYSYLRFSTPQQLKGDSFRRQTSLAEAYARDHGLELDQQLTFRDLGVSAYRGQNAEAGRLADFLEAVRQGIVPRGSVLLVEQLDRLSRLVPRRALKVLENIVEEGITVVTLNDGRSYTADSLDRDPLSFMLAVLQFIRANEESATKARRVRAAWDAKRSRIRERPLTSILPAWLELDASSGRIRLIEERAEIVRRIFEMTLEGHGQHRVAETLNREGIKPWGRGQHWHRSYVVKILRNPAVIGTFTPHTIDYDGQKRKRTPTEPVEGYFPPAIPKGLWDEVQARLSSGRAVLRGRHASSTITNIVGGLASCPLCGGTMTRVNKGSRSRPSLVCSKAKVGAGCQYRSIPYSLVEDAIRQRLPERLADVPAGSAASEIDREILNVEEELSVLAERLEVISTNLSHVRSPTLAAELRRLEDETDRLQESRRRLVERREAASGPAIASRVERLSKAITDGSSAAAVNDAIRSLFRRVIVNYPVGTVDLEWTHGGTCSIPFMMPADLD